jgi:hypothetical protein
VEVPHHDLSEQIVLGHQALPSPLLLQLHCRLSFCCHPRVSAVIAVPLMAITTVIIITATTSTAAASLLVRFVDFSVAVAVVRWR